MQKPAQKLLKLFPVFFAGETVESDERFPCDETPGRGHIEFLESVTEMSRIEKTPFFRNLLQSHSPREQIPRGVRHPDPECEFPVADSHAFTEEFGKTAGTQRAEFRCFGEGRGSGVQSPDGVERVPDSGESAERAASASGIALIFIHAVDGVQDHLVNEEPGFDFPVGGLAAVEMEKSSAHIYNFSPLGVVPGQIAFGGVGGKWGEPVACGTGAAVSKGFDVQIDRENEVSFSCEAVCMRFPAHGPPEFAGAVSPGLVFKDEFGFSVEDDADLQCVMGVSVKVRSRMLGIFHCKAEGTQSLF